MSFDPTWHLGARRRALQPITGFNLNSAGGEQAWTGLPSKYIVQSLRAYDASATPVLATVGLFTATGGGGTTLVTAATITALTAAAKTTSMTLAAIAGTDYMTNGTLYLRCGVAQGTALTASFILEILDLS